MNKKELKQLIKEIISENQEKVDNYFTFGGYNHPDLRYRCVKITGTPSYAREKMFSLFDSMWGFQYDKQPRERVIDLNDAMDLYEKFKEMQL